MEDKVAFTNMADGPVNSLYSPLHLPNKESDQLVCSYLIRILYPVKRCMIMERWVAMHYPKH